MDLHQVNFLLGALMFTVSPTIASELNCVTGDGSSYRGTIAWTWTGQTCQSWSSQTPHKHTLNPSDHPDKGLDKNYCRNPNNEFMPWCFTTDPKTPTAYCRLPFCGNAPGPEECIQCNGENYRGNISNTESGFPCQRWDSQTPHQHNHTPSAHPEKHLEENYCRNPSASPWPWCYTTNPSKRWEYCSILRCTSELPAIVPELTCITGDSGAYRGTIAVTESGKTCQSWSAQTPHKHNHIPCNYPCKGLESNYCCNLNHSKRPWCYTTDPDTRWEYCCVPRCGK